MKLLFLTDVLYPDSIGGANKYIYYLAKGLAKRGHEVFVLVRKARPELSDSDQIDGIQVHRYSVGTESPSGFVVSSYLRSKDIFSKLSSANSYDAMLIQQPLTGAGVTFCRHAKPVPKVYIFHSPWHVEYEIKAEEMPELRKKRLLLYYLNVHMRRLIEKKVMDQSSVVVVLSDFMKREAMRIHHIRTDRIAIIPGGVDTELFCPARDRLSVRKDLGFSEHEFILLCVRNLRPRMGIENLVKGIIDVSKAADAVRLVIGGTGAMEAPLKKLARNLGIEAIVDFVGSLSESDLVRYYQAADYFILPTRALEGFGLVTLEAMSCGTPVLGTPAGATPEILDRFSNEFVFEGTDPNAMSRLIIEKHDHFRKDPLEYEKLREQCRAFSSKYYSWNRIVDQWEQEILDKL